MKNICLGLIATVVLSSSVARAAEPSATAPDRTTPYQREVRAALTERNWRITQDEAGKLIAERYRMDGSGAGEFAVGGNNKYTRLEILFRTDARNNTASSAYASLCIYEPVGSYHPGYLVFPPLALHDPKLTQEYRDIVAEANSHLAAGTSNKLAMK